MVQSFRKKETYSVIKEERKCKERQWQGQASSTPSPETSVLKRGTKLPQFPQTTCINLDVSHGQGKPL
jgi:hypothetical protein